MPPRQPLHVADDGTAVLLGRDLGQQVEPRDDLAELALVAQVALLGVDLIGQQQRAAPGIAALRQHPHGRFQIARGVVQVLRVQPVDEEELGLAAVRGDQHVGHGVDEGGHAVVGVLGREGQGQRVNVAALLQRRPAAALLDGRAQARHRLVTARRTALAPFGGVAAVELVGQAVQRLQVLTHGDGGHAVDVRLAPLPRAGLGALDFALVRGGGGSAGAQQRQGQHGAGGVGGRAGGAVHSVPL